MRRRRTNPSSSSASLVARPGVAPDGAVEADDASEAASQTPTTIKSPKTVEEIVQDEEKSFTQFLGLCGLVTIVFLFLIQTTSLPPSRQVYAVMIDAGSTGTRAQIFRFVHDQHQDRLVLSNTEMHTIKKSIAALGTGIGGTGPQFFKPLLDKAKKSVPGIRRRKRTPIILRATAGLRMLGSEAADLALKHSREALNNSEFLFLEEYAGILDARQEAIYGWTTVNHLLGRIGVGETSEHASEPPVAIMEMGGASMQIVHTVSGTEADDDVIVKGSTQKIKVGQKSYTLRLGTYHGLGLVEYMKRMYRIFDTEGVLEEVNPCFKKGRTFEDKVIRIGFDENEEGRRVTIVGDGDFDRCVASAEIVIASTTQDNAGIGKLPKSTKAYAFAFFYDRTIGFGLGPNPTKKEMIEKGEELCQGNGYSIASDFDEACAQFSFIYALIKMATDNFSEERDVKVTFEQHVDSHMLGWALGAVLDVIEPHVHTQISLDNEPLTIS